MKNDKITLRSEDFAKWYTDVVKAARLADYSSVKGFVILEPNGYAVMGVIGKYNVPVIMDADIGHLPPSMPVVSGSYAKVNVKADDITIEYQFK